MPRFPQRQNDQLLDVRVVPSQRVIFTPGGQVSVCFLVDIRPATKMDHSPPVDMRFVIDRSGSMGEAGINDSQGTSKINAVRAGVGRVVIDDLMAGDFAMMEAFNNGSQTIIPHQQLTDEVRAQLAEKILGLRAQGNTHFSVAMETAMMAALIPNTQPRIIFLTDGESTYRQDEDFAQMEKLAKRSHRLHLPWLIFGTGIRYNLPWLERLALMAAPGSSFKHVSDINSLEADLRGEISFMRGLAVDRLKVSAKTERGIKIDRACHFMPVLHELKIGRGGYDFHDDSGGLDHFRGQQYLIFLNVDQPDQGEQQLLKLAFQGVSLAQGQLNFKIEVPLSIRFTSRRSQATAPEEEVVQAQQKLVAQELVQQQQYDAAAQVYRKAGDPVTADLIQTLGNTVARGGDRGRDAIYTAGSVVTRVHTQDHTVLGSDDDPDDTPSQS